MKPHAAFQSVFALVAFAAFGQGSFQYDQQSSDENNFQEGGAGIQSNQPMGQSFAPAFSSVGFIRLFVFDNNLGNNLGATLHLNLRADSITGTILATTDLVVLPDVFIGTVDFIFPDLVAVNPGTTYYFQPVVQSGDGWGLNASFYTYSGGTAFSQGVALPNVDLWFREGIIPEPSSVALILLGLGGFVFFGRGKTIR